MADDQWSGYFFEYNKLFWYYSGERVTVGELMRFDGVAELPQDLLRRVLATPIRLKTREKYQALLGIA